MPRFLLPRQYIPNKKERYRLPPTTEQVQAAKLRNERIRDFRLPLDGHEPGQALPPVAEDPRLRRYRRPQRYKLKPLDIPADILREGARNPLGARLPALLPDEDSAVAQKIWLPNLRIFLIRNGPRHARDPYIATFRVPRQLNKVDIVQYLRQVYGVSMNGIRTVIQYPELVKQPGRRKSAYRKPILKKAIIQLNEPFFYPKEHNPYYLNKHFDHPIYGMRTATEAIRAPDLDMSYPAFKERQGRERRQAEDEVIERMRFVRAQEAEKRGWAKASATEAKDATAPVKIESDEFVPPTLPPSRKHETAPPSPWIRKARPFDLARIPRVYRPRDPPPRRL